MKCTIFALANEKIAFALLDSFEKTLFNRRGARVVEEARLESV